MRVSSMTASAVPPPMVLCGGVFSGSSKRIASRNSLCQLEAGQSEVGHLVDPVDGPAIGHPPIARRPVEVLEADHASQDDVVDRLFGDLVEEGLDMGTPLRVRAVRHQAVNKQHGKAAGGETGGP